MKKIDSGQYCSRQMEALEWEAVCAGGQRSASYARHLEGCPHCRREAELLRATLGRIRGAVKIEPSSRLAVKINRAFESEVARREAVRRGLSVVVRVAAVFVAMGAGLWLWSGRDAGDVARGRVIASQTQSQAAIAWLVAQQEPDGSWLPSRFGGNDAYVPALTSLAVLALHQQREPHHEAVEKGVAALIAMQNEDGSFRAPKSSMAYNHAFSSYALHAIAAAGGESKSLAEACAKSVSYALDTQNYQGAWDYTGDGSGNTALTTWVIAVLVKARQAGWQDRQGHLRRGLAWLRQQSGEGGFGYRQIGVPLPGTTGLTLSAMATVSLLDAARVYPSLKPVADDALRKVEDMYAESGVLERDIYRDYFLARLSENAIDAFGRSVEERISLNTLQPGLDHWRANDTWGRTGGDLYATSLALLSKCANRAGLR